MWATWRRFLRLWGQTDSHGTGGSALALKADRWLHLRHQDGFDANMFERFRAGCALWDAYVQTSIPERKRLGHNHGDPSYTCLPATLSADRRFATLPLASRSTLASRADYENGASYLLSEFLSLPFFVGLEEGLTEDIGGGNRTNWRKANHRPARAGEVAGEVVVILSGKGRPAGADHVAEAASEGATGLAGQESAPALDANRWLHLRHQDGFDASMFEHFRAGCTLWNAYVQTSIRERTRLGHNHGNPVYTCLPATLSADRRVATLPLAGRSTPGSRADYEDSASYLLFEFMGFQFCAGLEEGLTEDSGGGRTTTWRKVAYRTVRVAEQAGERSGVASGQGP